MSNIKKIFAVIFAVMAVILMQTLVFADVGTLNYTVEEKNGDLIMTWEAYPDTDFYWVTFDSKYYRKISVTNGDTQDKRTINLYYHCWENNPTDGQHNIFISANDAENNTIAQMDGGYTFVKNFGKLNPPTNVRWEGKKAVCDLQDGAVAYAFTIVNAQTGESEYAATLLPTNEWDLSGYELINTQQYIIIAKAIGDIDTNYKGFRSSYETGKKDCEPIYGWLEPKIFGDMSDHISKGVLSWNGYPSVARYKYSLKSGDKYSIGYINPGDTLDIKAIAREKEFASGTIEISIWGVDEIDQKITLTYSGTCEVKTDKYNISYNAGEGSGTTESVMFYDGDTFTFPECTFTPPYEDYVFAFWSADLAGYGQPALYLPGEKVLFRIGKDAVITATYKHRDLTVTFDLGAECPYTIPPQTVIYEDNAERPQNTYEYNGKYIIGWYTDPTLRTPLYEFDFSSLITEDITLYAGWKDITNEFLIGQGGTHFVYYGDEIKLNYYGSNSNTYKWTVRVDGQDIEFTNPNVKTCVISAKTVPAGKTINAGLTVTPSSGRTTYCNMTLNVIYKQGDIDGSGAVDNVDAAMLLKHISNAQKITDTAIFARADTDYNGNIDMLDVIAILNKAS